MPHGNADSKRKRRTGMDLIPESVKKLAGPDEMRNLKYAWYSGRMVGEPNGHRSQRWSDERTSDD